MAVKYTNNAIGHLSAAIDTDDTTITLMSGEGAMFPSIDDGSGDWFPCTLVNVNGQREIVKVTGRSGDVFTVVRNQEGTTPLAWIVNDRFELRLTAAVMAQLVPDSRKINNQALTKDITLTAANVGAVAVDDKGIVSQALKLMSVSEIWTDMSTTPLEMGHLGGAAGDFMLDIHTDGGETSQDYKYRVTFRNDGNGVSLSSGAWIGANVGAGSYSSQYSNYAPFYQTFSSSSTSEYHPLIKQQAISTSNNQDWTASQGWLVNEMSWQLHLISSTGTTLNWSFKTSDKSFNAPGQVIPQDYGNFDSHNDGRYQKINTASKASNGWFKDSNTGLIFQWAYANGGGANMLTINFPIAFPTNCICVQNTIKKSGSGGDNWSVVSSFSTTSCTVGEDGSGAYILAIGY